MHFPLSPPLSQTVFRRGEREGPVFPRSADGRIAGLLPLRLSLWRREGGGAVDLCPKLVDSRVGLSFGAGRVVVAAAVWNKVANASSPLRRGHVWRIREAAGVWCPQIRRSGGRWCSGLGRRREEGGRRVEILFPVPVFTAAGCALALPCRIWDCGGRPGRLYRSFSLGSSRWLPAFGAALGPPLPAMVVRGGVLLAASSVSSRFGLLPSPAGRGGEGRWWEQDVQVAATSASCVRARCRVGWRLGGCGEGAPWLCAFTVFSTPSLAADGLCSLYMSGVLPFSRMAAAWCLLLRRARRWRSSGVAVVQRHLQEEACPAVCEICGSRHNQEFMARCIQCKDTQHRYCLEVVAFEISGRWCCSECQKKANGNTKPVQGESKAPMLDNNRRSMAHQIGVKTPQIYENSKVKFIPCEEAALLTKERPATRKRARFVAWRTHSQVRPVSPPNMKCSPSRQFRPASPPNVKPSSSMKSILPSRQVGSSSSRSMKQKCVSPSRSDNQVFASRPCVVANQILIKVDDINMRQKVRSGATIPIVPQNSKRAAKENDHLLRPKEEKVDSARKQKGNSWVDYQPCRENALNSSVPTDANIGCQSGPKSLHCNIDMPVIISSSAEYARCPLPEAICWTGCFVLSNRESPNLGEFKAYYPSRVSRRVCNIAKNIPNNLELKILPRMNYWPKTFDQICPVYEDVALLFFSAEDRCEKKRCHLFDTYCGFVMKAYIDGMMLLIYSSEMLPPDSQWIDGENYLWGVFVKPKAKSNPVT